MPWRACPWRATAPDVRARCAGGAECAGTLRRSAGRRPGAAAAKDAAREGPGQPERPSRETGVDRPATVRLPRPQMFAGPAGRAPRPDWPRRRPAIRRPLRLTKALESLVRACRPQTDCRDGDRSFEGLYPPPDEPGFERCLHEPRPDDAGVRRCVPARHFARASRRGARRGSVGGSGAPQHFVALCALNAGWFPAACRSPPGALPPPWRNPGTRVVREAAPGVQETHPANGSEAPRRESTTARRPPASAARPIARWAGAPRRRESAGRRAATPAMTGARGRRRADATREPASDGATSADPLGACAGTGRSGHADAGALARTQSDARAAATARSATS
jgi:hypothetical protein